MSHSDNQILQVVVDDDDDSEEVVGGVHENYEEEKQKQKKRGFFCYRRNIRRAKQVVLSKFKHTSTKPHLSPPPPPSGTVVADSKGFCFCFKKPLTLESSPVESLCSDPNHPNFSYDLLKSLIENNDFYSKESNPHLLP